MTALFDIVVPTAGRDSLGRLLEALATARGPRPGRVIVVDDRPDRSAPLLDEVPGVLAPLVEVAEGRAAGPASARNLGWSAATAEWVAFLDDDVVVPADWLSALADDLAALPREAAASQAILEVPRPAHRPATDWERNVAGLEQAAYATADIAYRRSALEEVGGFDERFPRAYREDSDIALRVMRAGYRIIRGRRRVVHPVGPSSLLQSVRLQAGNADDALMAVLHGPGWRDLAGAPRGRRRMHLTTTAAGLVGAVALAAGRRRTALVSWAGWLGLTVRFAWLRAAPGPRTPEELATVALTSALVPAAASYHWMRGWVTLPRRLRSPGPQPAAPAASAPGAGRSGGRRAQGVAR